MKRLFFDGFGGVRPFWVIAFFSAIPGLVAWVLVYALTSLSGDDCDAYQVITGRKTTFAVTTCYVEVNGAFMPRDEFEYRAISNEIPEAK
ncbi:hypothetical protein M7963_05800 [Enterobacter roggenkampii]|uniref:hypothetical protein n=1 Tax=Enterobacter roggenkampii TaxID=1812935 RepID=UPI0022376F55|nr:hypothetical protein [Enterobacter roggenkampii]MCW5001025.1 hypothetical protein [Enterobacter roggenkampii]